MGESDQDIKTMLSKIKGYITTYEKSSKWQPIIQDFCKLNSEIDKYIIEKEDRNNLTSQEAKKFISLHGKAYCIYLKARYKVRDLTYESVSKINKLILDIERYSFKHDLYEVIRDYFYELGRCWYRVGRDDNAIECFKKYLYYYLCNVNKKQLKKISNKTAYAFRRCSTFVYQSLINEELNVSSPSTFNDPYDCPLIELLNNNRSKIHKLIRKACLESIKIACFVRNTKLEDVEGKEELKREGDKDEYLNSLMWAHYADSHKGICIKYRLPNDISVLNGGNPYTLSLLGDVEYNDKKLGEYPSKSKIAYEDAFFLKVEDWKYENELRLLHFDLENSNPYKSIDIPNCIEAIYFGLKCPDVERETIMKIMKEKQFVEKNIEGKVIRTESVKFYQMKVDKDYCGRLVAEEIQ